MLMMLVGAQAIAQTAPTATITVVSPTGKVNEPAVFAGSCSAGLAAFDDGYVNWDFGDGFKASIIRATHVYRAAGTYTVTLTIKCGNGQTATTNRSVTVSEIAAATGNNLLTVVTNGSGNGTTTFNTIQAAVNRAATLNSPAPVEIILPAGAVFDESVQLTVPVGNNYITLKSSLLSNLAAGKRVDRTQLSSFATILAPNNGSAVRALPNFDTQSSVPSHHYRFQGIQFKTKPGVNNVYQIVQMGINDSYQNSMALTPHHIIIDRCLVYSENVTSTGLNTTKFGIYFDSTKASIVDSHISNINGASYESKAIAVDNTVGILGFVNNYLEAGASNILFGGSIPNVVTGAGTKIVGTKDVEFRRNRCHKPLAKRALTGAQKWNSENNFEIKSGQYFVIEGNLFDTSWDGESPLSRQRWLVNLRVATDTAGDKSILRDIQFTSNKLKQGANGLLIIGKDFNPETPDGAADRILVKNNSTEEISSTYAPPGGTQTYGQALEVEGVPKNLVIRHNTLFNSYALMGVGQDPSTWRHAIIFNDNIGPHSQVGIWGVGTPYGDSTITTYFPGGTFLKNVIAGQDTNGQDYSSRYSSILTYPGQNFFPTNLSAQFVNLAGGDYHLSAASPGKGAASENNGADVGADIDLLNAATKGAISGDWGGGSLEDVVWTNLVGVTANGNDLTKASTTTGWNAGATSVQTLSGNGYVEFSTDDTTTGKACGLNSNHVGQNYTEIDYVITIGGNGYVRIYENGTAIPKPGTTSDYLFGNYAAGDVFRVEINNGVVKYYWNGAVMVEHAITAASQYVVDTSFSTPGAKITNAVISGAWSN
jgi:PKD domain